MHIAPGRGQAQHVGDGEERGHYEQVVLGEHLEAHSGAGRTFLRSFFGGGGTQVTNFHWQDKRSYLIDRQTDNVLSCGRVDESSSSTSKLMVVDARNKEQGSTRELSLR